MSIDKRDSRPPANKFAEVEAALDKRLLTALAAAWKMAADRGIITGSYATTSGEKHHA